MQGVGVALTAVVAVLLAVGCQAALGGGRGGSSSPEGGLTRPLRPAVFHTPEELRHYLDAVSNYYAVASRPGRFGKRSSSHRPREGRVQLLRREAPLDSLLPEQLAEEAPDYLFQFAPGPAPTPASDMYPLFLDQERLAQARPNQE